MRHIAARDGCLKMFCRDGMRVLNCVMLHTLCVSLAAVVANLCWWVLVVSSIAVVMSDRLLEAALLLALYYTRVHSLKYFALKVYLIKKVLMILENLLAAIPRGTTMCGAKPRSLPAMP